MFLAIGALLLIAGFFFVSVRSASRSPEPVGVPLEDVVDVSAILIAIDWRARAIVQQRLRELAKGDTSTNAGLMNLLRQTVEVLHQVQLGWLHVGAYNSKPMPPHQAQVEFVRITGDLRIRFRHELQRNVDGSLRTANAPSLQAKAEEGEGVVVVSLVIAAKGPL